MDAGQPGSDQDYCQLGRDHTMCQYQGQGCNTIVRELNDNQRQAILDRHNELRRKIALGQESSQHPASNMKKLKWDPELEAIAQRWADQCTFDHDANKKKLDGTSVGQNVAWSFSSNKQSGSGLTSTVIDGVQRWYNEVHDPGFGSHPESPFSFDYGTGHYTQVVWADTEFVGCGMVNYRKQGYEVILVCNYAVAGNFAREVMYKVGEACSACPSGYSCEDGLCSRQ